MIKISKFEAKELNKMGVRYGENGISHTHGHNKNYFLTESKKNISLLDKLRKESIIQTKNKYNV